MKDKYPVVNERIRKERRRQVGQADVEPEPLMRAVAQELGAAVEAALTIAIDRGQGLGLRLLQRAASLSGASGGVPLARIALLASRMRSFGLPQTSGQIVSASSFRAMRNGFRVLRLFRELLEAMR